MAIKYRLVAGMATMPSRSHTAPLALQSLIGQFDNIYLVLNGFQQVPDWADIPGVIPIHPKDNRDYGAAGKLLGLSLLSDIGNTIYFCVDDDLEYPNNFALRLVNFLSKNQNSIIGIHGSLIKENFKSWRVDRKIYGLKQHLPIAKKVDVIATNGCAFFAKALDIDSERWPISYKNCVDLFFAKHICKHGLESWVISKSATWLRQLEEKQPDSIYLSLLRDDSKHTRLAIELLAIKRSSKTRRLLKYINNSLTKILALISYLKKALPWYQ
jgi:hypothetical protein